MSLKNGKIYELDRVSLLLRKIGTYSQELNIDLFSEKGRFCWFLASILFGKRVSEAIAIRTYRVFERNNILSAESIISAGWSRIVEMLDEGGYVRYDFSTATRLIEIMEKLRREYGSLEELYRRSLNQKELEKHLLSFKGIGSTTIQIFFRELRGIWAVDPPVSEMANSTAQRLSLDLSKFKGRDLGEIESALVKLTLRYCKKKRCKECPLKNFCSFELQ